MLCLYPFLVKGLHFNSYRSKFIALAVIKSSLQHNKDIALLKNIHHSSSYFQNAEASTDEDDMPQSDMENPYRKSKVQCVLCKYKIKVNYKNTKLLSQFISPYTGRIYNKHITGLCQEQQTAVVNEIRKAQASGYMPYVFKELRFVKDPPLFDPFKPTRPHPH